MIWVIQVQTNNKYSLLPEWHKTRKEARARINSLSKSGLTYKIVRYGEVE